MQAGKKRFISIILATALFILVVAIPNVSDLFAQVGMPYCNDNYCAPAENNPTNCYYCPKPLESPGSCTIIIPPFPPSGDCIIPECGDGVAYNTPGEQCDEGDDNGPCPGSQCTEDCQICLYCGDDICSPPGENSDNCPIDCPVGPFCGDGEINQDWEQCDYGANNGVNTCPTTPWCTSGSCNLVSCPPPPFCGDGICNGSDTCGNCTSDCGQCPVPLPAACEGADLSNLWPIVPDCDEWGWVELVLVAQRLINFLIALSIPLVALGFAVAGFIYITAAGSEEKIKRAHSIFWKIAIGFTLVLGAWLIVYTITHWLLPGYRILIQ